LRDEDAKGTGETEAVITFVTTQLVLSLSSAAALLLPLPSLLPSLLLFSPKYIHTWRYYRSRAFEGVSLFFPFLCTSLGIPSTYVAHLSF
jgi:hypothetical protein